MHAARGSCTLLRTQPNAVVHAMASLSVAVAGLTLRVSRMEWALLAVAVGLVWAAEAFNTAIEFLADEVSLERKERIKHAKDVAACGVLVCAIVSAVIGLLVFIPHAQV